MNQEIGLEKACEKMSLEELFDLIEECDKILDAMKEHEAVQNESMRKQETTAALEEFLAIDNCLDWLDIGEIDEELEEED